jgi:cation diffusion facilitator family transporter
VDSPHLTGRRVALASMVVGACLAFSKILIGWMAGSTAVVADGVESAADVLASGLVLFGLAVAARPPDANHPYGHGRVEILSGLGVGLLLSATGSVIAQQSILRLHTAAGSPAAYALWPLAASISIKSILCAVKFRYGRRIRSAGLIADAWNDSVDILSGIVALVAVALSIWNPAQFSGADHYGGFAVGLLVIFLGVRVVWESSLQLMDTMPDERDMEEIRAVARQERGVLGIEKCFARKTGLQYHVDLHLEVDPDMTVRESHAIASRVRDRLKGQIDWVADVLVHVEPYGME